MDRWTFCASETCEGILANTTLKPRRNLRFMIVSRETDIVK
jgi:hypothetical protein